MMMIVEQSRHSSQNNAVSILPFVACRRRNTLFSIAGRPVMCNPLLLHSKGKDERLPVMIASKYTKDGTNNECCRQSNELN